MSIDSGDYGELVTVDSLKEFHRRRLEVLSISGADVLAIETIPSLQEAQVRHFNRATFGIRCQSLLYSVFLSGIRTAAGRIFLTHPGLHFIQLQRWT